MRLLLAILITVGLLATSDLLSILFYFDLLWILVVSTSLWAAIDSTRIGLQRYKLIISCRPVLLFSICSLFWIFVFPWYLWARFKIKADEVDFKEENLEEAGKMKPFFRRFSKNAARVAEYALLLTVVAILAIWSFFTVESWRAPRIWTNYKQQLEAKGETLDWNDEIPPLVPDSQNFFEAPMMSEWFVRPIGGINIGNNLQFLTAYTNITPRLQIASITIGPQSNTSNGDIILNFDDFESHRQAMQLLQNTAGKGMFDAIGSCILTAQPFATIQVKPLKIFLLASKTPDISSLKAFFTGFPSGGAITFTPAGSNSFYASAQFASANDYLKWSDQFDGDFNLMRDALQRPYARINGNYDSPIIMPIPNFISLRCVSQTLAEQAKCHLLLGQPDKALQELTLLNNLRRTLEFAPSNKPMSLVTAMINVAILGVYVDTINDGFQLNAWEKPQLETLKSQLQQINLAPFLKNAFHEDEVYALRLSQQMFRQYDIQRDLNLTLRQKNGLVYSRNILPAIYYLNIMNVAKLDEPISDCIDSHQDIVWPQKVAALEQDHDNFFKVHFWQFDKLLALIAVPDFSRALQKFAHHQNEVNEAEIVCALEQYRLLHSSYPKALDALVPQYIHQLPNDVIDGQTMKYRLISDDQFVLYSIGWDKMNDGSRYMPSLNFGDWTWLGH
ncbi:MAG TPA: hypothetical protein VGI03_12025 [Verrucomicrobiae bacterium]|jgi:hypothetical protein